ncbi:MAG: matrixin family metalloprotease [Phycisphaerales bacterium]
MNTRPQTTLVGMPALASLSFFGAALGLAGVGANMGPAPVAPSFEQERAASAAPTRSFFAMQPRCVTDLPGVPMSLCFAPGVPEERVLEISQKIVDHWAQQNADGAAYELNARWNLNGSSTQGTPVVIRWSMPADGLSLPDEIGIGMGTGANDLNAKFATKFGSTEAGKNLLRQVFQRWSDLSGITYTEVSDDNGAWGLAGGATRGDVRIAGRSFGTAGSGILAYNEFPQDGDMVINTRSNEMAFWTSTNNNRYFRNIVAHEHGHGMGLLHVCPVSESKLMEPFISTNFDGPQHDDIRGAQRHYGDTNEPNDTPATAASVFNVSGNTTVLNQSIDDNADMDYFKFTATAGTRVTLRATPVGFSSYLTGPQTQACNTGTATNSLSVQNIGLQLYQGAAGTTLLVNQNTAAAGTAEEITDYLLTANDTYVLRVFPSTTTDNIQLYTLTATITPGRLGDLNGDGVVDGADLGVLLASWGNNPGSPADLNGDGVVDGADLGVLLANWG